MSGTTTELGLQTAVDSDDNADYLTLALANSLRTIDALFNNVTGHTHSSAHQGGPLTVGAGNIADGSISSAKIADGSINTIDLADGSVTSAKLKPPIDIGDWFRSTGHPTAMAGSGQGLEMFFNPGPNEGVLQAYDRGASAWRPIRVAGSTLALQANNGQGLSIAADGSVTVYSLSSPGDAAVRYLTVSDGSNGIVSSRNGSLYLRSAGGAAGVIIDTGTGGLNVAAGPISSAGRITSGTDLVVNGGIFYLGSAADTVLTRSGAGSFTINNQLHFDRDSGGGPAAIYWPGGATIANGTSVGRGGNVVYMSPHAFVFFDLEVGHIVTCQSVVQTSDPNLKNSATLLADPACMTRVRANVPVYTYQLDPPPPPTDGTDAPTPTPTDIGMMATDVFAASPEFAALNESNQPVGVNYANMAALLWGALRDLDRRCTAFGVPAA